MFVPKTLIHISTHLKHYTTQNMFKKVHKSQVIDRNADIPTAGVSTQGVKGGKAMRNCLDIAHPEELAESLVRANSCGQSSAKFYIPDGPVIPVNSIQDLLTVELQKSRFASFKEEFFEELYFKRAKVGEVQPAFSKPESVTNMSRTFGCPSSLTPTTSLYALVMPPKTPEQVSKEFKEFHEQRIVSHNHYFPAEQINRKYSKSFDRHNPCGEIKKIGDHGLKVKNCLTEGENHVKVIGKAQVDFMERTVAPLGKKIKKYLYEVPDITFGVIPPSTGDVKTVIYNIVANGRTDRLMDALSHLNAQRIRLRERDDIHLPRLVAIMERSDPELTGLLPIARLVEILRSYRISLETQKIRIVMSHYQMIVDEGLCSERVKYREFCKLLSSKEPLPSMGSVSTYADVGSLDTTYRLFCADLQNQQKVSRGHKVEKDRTGMKELLSPETDALGGLQASDFTQLRPKKEIEQVFRNLIAKEEFEVIWQSLMAKKQDQEGLASVTQFSEEVKLAKENF
ncbi:EF-hand domain-containing family member B [Drosophila kikkawai]|uniref:EF-hand domain-containing family member B n=1 Tax=Drosophila kikkawai TaxID=30033 RepID=A0A6P4HZD2_DROKI